MSDRRYDAREIEAKWQAVWADERTWEVANGTTQEAGGRRHSGGHLRPDKSYVLEMLPYPSGEPHIGHLKNYAIGDAIAHFRRRTGHRVLHPMGYDCFGLPAENNAIKTGVPPARCHRAVDRLVPEGFPLLGYLDRLVARDREPRAGLLPLDPVDLPAALQARARLPQGIGGQLVPPRPDGARQRAGDRRPLRALRRTRSSCASSSSGSSVSPITPTACSTTSTRSTGPSTSRRCNATGSAAASAPRSISAVPSSASTIRSSRRAPTRCSARPSS